jgi:hypothetical protein
MKLDVQCSITSGCSRRSAASPSPLDDDAGLAAEFEQVAEVLADLRRIDVDRADQLDGGLLQGEAGGGEADGAEAERNGADDRGHAGSWQAPGDAE